MFIMMPGATTKKKSVQRDIIKKHTRRTKKEYLKNVQIIQK